MSEAYIEFFDNDAYILAISCGKIITNDNYNGILIYNHQFEIIKKIPLIDGMNVSSIMTNSNEILLFCADNNLIIYINLADFEYVLLNVEKDEIFNYKYSFWHNKVIILVSGYKFFSINLVEKKIVNINEDFFSDRFKQSYEIYKKLSVYNVFKYFQLQKKAIIRKDSTNLCIINYKNKIFELCEFKEKEFHDFEIYNNIIIKISERMVEVTKDGITKYIISDYNYSCFKGKLLNNHDNNTELLFLLYGNNSNENNSLLLRICLDSLFEDKMELIKMSSMLK